MTAALASGGLDSAAMMAMLAAAGPVWPVYVRSGLSWEEAELTALRSVRSCARLGPGSTCARSP